jgi:hypothetical protein
LANDADNRQVVVVYAQRRPMFEFGGIKTNHLQSGGVRSVAFDVTSVLKGQCTNSTVVVSYFSNSEPASGLPVNALLILESPFFPYGSTGMCGERWVIGGDVYRGVFSSAQINSNKVEHLADSLVTYKSDWLSKDDAIQLAVNNSSKGYAGIDQSKLVVEAVKRYAFGWLIQLGTPPDQVYGYWIVVVGDDGVVKDTIGGL